MKNKGSRANSIVEVIKSIDGLKIEIRSSALQHAFEGHPEVTLGRIRQALAEPVKVIRSKRSNRVCLFYSFECQDPVFGEIYFCAVVGVIGPNKGSLETAYETTYIKSGEVLFDGDKVRGKRCK